MAISEQKLNELQRDSTYSSFNYLKILPLLPLLVSAPQFVGVRPGAVTSDLSIPSHSTNQSAIVQQEIAAIDIVYAINELHDRLVNGQKNLDADSASLLYENRWELYI